MGALLVPLLGLLSNLPGMVGQYFAKKQELEQLKIETQAKLEFEKQQLAGEIAKADLERAKEALSSTTPMFKHCVFWMLSSPFISCLIGYPEYAQMVFANLNALPEWYLVIYTGIIGVIFGIPVPGTIMGNIWEGIKASRQNSREYKLAKLNRKAVADALRKANGPLTQSQVDGMDKMLDLIEKDGFGNGDDQK